MENIRAIRIERMVGSFPGIIFFDFTIIKRFKSKIKNGTWILIQRYARTVNPNGQRACSTRGTMICPPGIKWYNIPKYILKISEETLYVRSFTLGNNSTQKRRSRR